MQKILSPAELAARSAKWRAAQDPAKIKDAWARANHTRRLKDRGLSPDDYESLLSVVPGCAICGSMTNENGSRLTIDHDHKTGRVRGILCHACNTALGKFKDDPELLRRAIEYLR